MNEHDSPINRRTALGTITAATLLPFTGCTAAGDPPDNESNAIEAISTEDLHLVVELREDSVVDELSIVDPAGKSFATASVAQGVRTVSFDLGATYLPGEFGVYATRSGTQVGESTLEIRPDIRITDLKLARNHPTEMYDGASEYSIASEAIVTVENFGTGPDAITNLRFVGDVPYPDSELFEESGIYDTQSEHGGNREQVQISSEQELVLFSSSHPFSPAADDEYCRRSLDDGSFTVEVDSHLTNTPVKTRFEISFRGRSGDDCDITISEV
ncbi:hypothetical protein [Halorarum halobium]|uniref:hypothetical protein n=1 Tax=Halorarum halobium TaxID=3075121 RepID=UPI0028ABC89C|nr:hypothetical protein [Halobaculum sp. XH14]